MKYVSDEVNKFKKLGLNTIIPDDEYQDNIKKFKIDLKIIHEKKNNQTKSEWFFSVSTVKDYLQN